MAPDITGQDQDGFPFKLSDYRPLGQGAIAVQWNFPNTPTFYVIDHKGLIRHKWVGSPSAETIDAALEKLIKVAETNGAGQR